MTAIYTYGVADIEYGDIAELSFVLAEEDDGAAADVIAALQLFSYAGLQGARVARQSTVQPTTAPTAGRVQLGAAARLTFADASGGVRTRLYLPQPTPGCFLADGKTVNVAYILPLLAAIEGSCVSRGGYALTDLVSGSYAQIALPGWPVYR